MAINIQEILHPSDSDSIKFSKINYNFDQILANGGGPVGPKGQKGIQGVVGQTGQKGEIGEKGIKGDSGETTSPWKSIAIDLDALDGVNNVTILKPKPGTDKETPTIWLGDSSFINDGNTAGDGDVSLRSTLNVGRHYNFSNSVVEAEYITLWHDADNKIKIDSENQTGYVRYNISPVQPLVGSAPDIRLQINTPTIHTETFQLSNQSATGTLESGMIRYNSGGNKFEGYINNAWVEFCMDPCGSGVAATIEISGGDINANADGTPNGDSISISGGDIDAIADGSPVGSLPLPVITNFDAYPVTGSSTEIECYWDSVSDSNDVTITWGTGGSYTNGGSHTVTNYTSATYTITGLTASTAYSIRMTATNATGSVQEDRTATTESAQNTTAPTEQQYTITFQGNGLTYNQWDINSATPITGFSGSSSNPNWNYNASTRQGTITAVAGDVLRISITASTGSGREWSSGTPFTVTPSDGTIITQQVQQNNTDGGLAVDITLGSSTTQGCTIEAGTQAISTTQTTAFTDITEWLFLNEGGGNIYFTYYNPSTGNMMTDSPLGAGQSRLKCNDNQAGSPYFSDSSGNPYNWPGASSSDTGQSGNC